MPLGLPGKGDEKLTFENVVVQKSADRGPDLLYVVLTEVKANNEKLVDLVLKYAPAALREAAEHKFKGTTKGDEKHKYDGNVVFLVQGARGDGKGYGSGFSVEQLQEILAAKDSQARELVRAHSWSLAKLPRKE
jgi:hypothetical protein